MIFVVAGVAAFLALAVVWARVSAGRAERHSVESYEHALGVLGGVARRGEQRAPIGPPAPEELARPHIQRPTDGARFRPAQPVDVPLPRVQLRPPTPLELGIPESVTSEKEDTSLVEEVPSSEPEEAPVIAFDDLEEVSSAPSGRRSLRRMTLRAPRNVARRAVTGAAAAVAIGALGVGGWELAVNHSNAPTTRPPAVSHQSHSKTNRATQVTTPSVAPSTIDPTSVSGTLVSYSLPEGSYTLSFTSTGTCWLGIQRSSSGPWQWMATVSASSPASHSADGANYLTLGAPSGLSISVNGVPLALPAGRKVAYKIYLVPSSATST